MTLSADVPLLTVLLTKPHTHAGKDYQAGDSIDVCAPERDFLLAIKKIELGASRATPVMASLEKAASHKE